MLRIILLTIVFIQTANASELSYQECKSDRQGLKELADEYEQKRNQLHNKYMKNVYKKSQRWLDNLEMNIDAMDSNYEETKIAYRNMKCRP